MKKIFALMFLFIGGLTICYCQQTYHILILKGTMEDLKTEAEIFRKKHPEIKAFISWESPNAYLLVGTCGKKKDALKLLKDLKLEYTASKVIMCDGE